MPDYDIAQLESLLLNPREELEIEIKRWLDLSGGEGKATLAKALIALANHGGGYVIIGYDRQDDGTHVSCAERPSTLDAYSQDNINGIVQSYANPPFHCSVHHIAHPQTRETYPIIVVPGGHKVPIQARRGSPDQRALLNGHYYIRRQGPQSAVPDTSEEWREFIMRCVKNGKDDLLNSIRDILAGRLTETEEAAPTETERLAAWTEQGVGRWQTVTTTLPENASARLIHGYYCVSYTILGDFQQPSLAGFRQLLERSVVHHTGWSPWWVPTRPGIAPYINDNSIECFLGNQEERVFPVPAHSDFWRASPDGKMFLIRGYDEDSHSDQIEPGQGFDLVLPTWRVGEAMLHAQRLTSNLNVEGARVIFNVKWSGLNNRRLITMGSGLRYYGMYGTHVCRQDTFEQQTTVDANRIDDMLPEILFGLLSPLYELFDFYRLPRSLVEQELRDMRRNRF